MSRKTSVVWSLRLVRSLLEEFNQWSCSNKTHHSTRRCVGRKSNTIEFLKYIKSKLWSQLNLSSWWKLLCHLECPVFPFWNEEKVVFGVGPTQTLLKLVVFGLGPTPWTLQGCSSNSKSGTFRRLDWDLGWFSSSRVLLQSCILQWAGSSTRQKSAKKSGENASGVAEPSSLAFFSFDRCHR